MVTIRGVEFGKAPRVLFDGVPARLLAVAESRIHALVPEEVGGRPLTIVEVESSRRSRPWGIPVTPFAPGIFGVLNQDGSQNGADRPAMRGTVVQIYATGAPAEAVGVLIGGAPASVVYAGSNDGLLQVNAVVPLEVEAGPAVPVVLTAGPARSQDGVRIVVE
jgi:uncharacterized protein (TIGR03437 family)